MLNPARLFLITCAAVALLSFAPYMTGRLVSPGVEPGTDGTSRVTALASATSMEDLPAPRPGAPVEALRTKMTEPPARKSESRRTSGKETEHPLPDDSKEKSKTEAASSKSAAKVQPTVTPKPELPYRAEVARAQECLLKLKQFDGKADGKLGPITQAAISSFQKKNGLAGKGETDSATMKTLEKAAAEATEADKRTADVADAKAASDKSAASSVPRADDPQVVVLRKVKSSDKPTDIGPVPRMTRVAEVKVLQEKLAQAKVYGGEPDGKWGHNTIVAMKEFQEKNHLEVTGKPDKETWQKLNETSAVSSDWEVVATTAKNKQQPKTSKDAGIVISDAKPSKQPISQEPLTIAVTKAALADAVPEQPKTKPQVVKETKLEPSVNELPVSKPAASSTVPRSNEAPSANSTQPPSLSASPAAVSGGDVLVKVNADAGPVEKQTLATPALISEAVKSVAPAETSRLENPLEPILLAPKPDEAESRASGESEEAAIQVKAPKREAAPASAPVQNSKIANTVPFVPAAITPSAQPSASPAPAVKIEESELPPAASKAAAARLEKELAEAQARIAMVSNDPRYELDKYAPKALEAVNGLAAKVKQDVSSNSTNSESARSNLRKIDEELEKAKQESLKQKAAQKVAQVDAIYKDVKKRFAPQIAKSTKSKDSASVKLADLMGKIDAGYSAMQADYKKGNYDPIVERCDGFKLQIEILGNEAAKDYLETTLEKSRKDLPKETVDEIEDLRNKNKYMEAATVLENAAGAKSSSHSKRKS